MKWLKLIESSVIYEVIVDESNFDEVLVWNTFTTSFDGEYVEMQFNYFANFDFKAVMVDIDETILTGGNIEFLVDGI